TLLTAWLSRVAGIGASASGNLIVMLVISDLRIDPRVEREARALAGAGYKITIIFPDFAPTESQPPELNWGEGITFRRLTAKSAHFISYWPGWYGGALFRAAVKHKPLAFHAHDLNSAFAALSAGRMTGAHVVCDFHEWSSENVRWNAKTGRHIPYAGLWKRALKYLERLCLRQASEIITVGYEIARELETGYGESRRVHVIRNIPALSATPTRAYPALKE